MPPSIIVIRARRATEQVGDNRRGIAERNGERSETSYRRQSPVSRTPPRGRSWRGQAPLRRLGITRVQAIASRNTKNLRLPQSRNSRPVTRPILDAGDLRGCGVNRPPNTGPSRSQPQKLSRGENRPNLWGEPARLAVIPWGEPANLLVRNN